VTQRVQPTTGKGAETRARILETSLRLFRERGYEGTTMRLVAKEAGVSVGNAYYYFKSKETLIQAFYQRTHREHLAACVDVLENETGFEERLRGVMLAKLRTIEPYHRFSGILFKTAADPESPLNPFSAESLPTRLESTALFASVVEGTKLRVSKDLWAELPNLLWIYHMGVVLFWIHDRSEGRRRTYSLVDHTVPLIVRIVKLGSLPLLRSLTRRATAFLEELREDVGIPEASDVAQEAPSDDPRDGDAPVAADAPSPAGGA
jgi:AcrR family transcriptional regulator